MRRRNQRCRLALTAAGVVLTVAVVFIVLVPMIQGGIG
jgi:hypothetical protein